MSVLKKLPTQEGLELISQQIDELSDCLEELNSRPEYTDRLSAGLWNGGWNKCMADAVAGMRVNIAALERSLTEETRSGDTGENN